MISNRNDNDAYAQRLEDLRQDALLSKDFRAEREARLERLREARKDRPLPSTARPPMFSDEELEAFKSKVSPLISIDLADYKPRQIERRIAALMSRTHAGTLDEFHDRLVAEPDRLQDFIDGLMINVTEFFRNPERFEDLRARVLPALLAEHETVRIWSAGCSLGAELLSVGLILEELAALDRSELVGTDVDHGIIDRAQQGLFTQHELQTLPEGYYDRYFAPEGNSHRFTSEAIMARTRYLTHNLLTDAPIAECQLILCRNVVIYFSGESKQRLYQKFVSALVPGGVLFVGSTERIFDYRDLGLQLLAPFFYQKPLG